MLRIKKLYIQNYKNIINQEFDFSENQGIIALVGENGSGKSNLLEAISHMFNAILHNSIVNFDYKLVYSIGKDEVIIDKTANDFAISVNHDQINIEDFRRTYLPSKIIANYSGEDSRLFNDCYKLSYYKFTRQLKSDSEIPKLPMIYLNKYYWDLCLLTLFLSDHSVRTDIADFCHTLLGIRSINEITFEIDLDIAKIWKDNETRQLLQAIFEIEDLSKIAEIDNAGVKGIIFVEDKNKKISAKITISLDELKRRIEDLFIEEQQIFLYLYSAFASKDYKLLKDIKFNLELTNGFIVGLDGFSEGEKKLILIEFITKIISDDNSIVLLDEPDAHTHISRKKELLKSIKSFEGQTILTTHSPMFVDILKNENLVFMRDGGCQDISIGRTINELSGGALGILGGAVISASRSLIITEGPDDKLHIKKAIDNLIDDNPQYKRIENIPIIWSGGAGNTESFYKSVFAPNKGFYKSVVFVFDHDDKGRAGFKKISKEMGKNPNLHALYYHETFPITEDSTDFYLEDFYPRSVYKDIKIHTINEDTRYYELKSYKDPSGSIKSKIKNNLEHRRIKKEEFERFRNFLDELTKCFD